MAARPAFRLLHLLAGAPCSLQRMRITSLIRLKATQGSLQYHGTLNKTLGHPPSVNSSWPTLRNPQGHIALDRAVFPTGTPGLALDTLARAPLWAMGLNYRHGTGHGVGAALNVHEGPQSISTRCAPPSRHPRHPTLNKPLLDSHSVRCAQRARRPSVHIHLVRGPLATPVADPETRCSPFPTLPLSAAHSICPAVHAEEAPAPQHKSRRAPMAGLHAMFEHQQEGALQQTGWHHRYHITTPLEAGMVVSNEPGYYEDGAFGIRIENLVVRRLTLLLPLLSWRGACGSSGYLCMRFVHHRPLTGTCR